MDMIGGAKILAERFAQSGQPKPERAPHPCQRCGSEEWEYVDYGGCSECRPYEERAREDDE